MILLIFLPLLAAVPPRGYRETLLSDGGFLRGRSAALPLKIE
jgi:hypothetical protein